MSTAAVAPKKRGWRAEVEDYELLSVAEKRRKTDSVEEDQDIFEIAKKIPRYSEFDFGRGQGADNESSEEKPETENSNDIGGREQGYGANLGPVGSFIHAGQAGDQKTMMFDITESKRFACDKCPRRFKSKGGLLYHSQAAHERVRKKPCTCGECGKAFISENSVIRHYHLKHPGMTPVSRNWGT